MATVAVAAVVPACGTPTVGTAKPAPDLGKASSSASAPTGPPSAPSATAKDHLLKGSELAAIVGAQSMEVVRKITEPTAAYRLNVQPFECVYRVGVASTMEYSYSGLKVIVGDVSRNPGDQAVTVTQVITVFDERDTPKSAADTAYANWSNCQEGQEFTTKIDDVEERWVANATTREGYRVETGFTRQGGPPRSCHHVLSGQGEVLVEAMTCGDGDIAAQADQVADRLLAGFPA